MGFSCERGAHTLAVRGRMEDAGRHGILGKLSNHWGPWSLGTPRGEGRVPHATWHLPVPQTVISSLRGRSQRPPHGAGPRGSLPTVAASLASPVQPPPRAWQ